MKKLFLAIGVFMSTTSIAQETTTETMLFITKKDTKENTTNTSNILQGSITPKDIVNDNTCTWYANSYANYTPDSTIIADLKKLPKQYTFTIFGGTWCEDTQIWLPRLMKVLEKIGYSVDSKNVSIYGVDRDKKTLNMEADLMKVEKVPTIVIQKGPREIGRIVESITEPSIEANVLKIITDDNTNWKE